MAERKPIISFRNFSFQYRAQKRPTLTDINLEIYPGERVLIAGPSGSGKTTLAYRLKERFGEDEVRLISHDSYYKRHDELPFAERCKLNLSLIHI